MNTSTLQLAEQSLVLELIDQHGHVSANLVAETFRMSKAQLAETLGLSPEALYKARRADAAKPQTRLKEMLEIIKIGRASCRERV